MKKPRAAVKIYHKWALRLLRIFFIILWNKNWLATLPESGLQLLRNEEKGRVKINKHFSFMLKIFPRIVFSPLNEEHQETPQVILNRILFFWMFNSFNSTFISTKSCGNVCQRHLQTQKLCYCSRTFYYYFADKISKGKNVSLALKKGSEKKEAGRAGEKCGKTIFRP